MVPASEKQEDNHQLLFGIFAPSFCIYLEPTSSSPSGGGRKAGNSTKQTAAVLGFGKEGKLGEKVVVEKNGTAETGFLQSSTREERGRR